MSRLTFRGGQRMADYKYYPETDELIKNVLPDGGNARQDYSKPGGIKATMISSLAIIAIGLVLIALMFSAPFAIAIGKFLLDPVGTVPVWAQIGIGSLILIIIFRIIRRK